MFKALLERSIVKVLGLKQGRTMTKTVDHSNKTSKMLPATHCLLLGYIKKCNIRDPVYKYKKLCIINVL